MTGVNAVAELLRFAKMHALGNDFMVLDLIRQHISGFASEGIPPAQVQQWSDRKRGIGFDQLLTLEPPTQLHQDFSSRIYNADGSRAGNCFNGARCLAFFAHIERLIAPRQMHIVFDGGEIALQVASEPHLPCAQVRLQTTAVQLQPQPPLFAAGANSVEQVRVQGREFSLRLLSVGNPHAVFEMASDEPFDEGAPAILEELGRALQTLPLFPDGVNLSMITAQTSGNRLRAHVYERGVGVTEACGTAAVAVAALQMANAGSCGPVCVEMGQEQLTVSRSKADQSTGPDAERVELVGPACMIYKGQLLLPNQNSG
ncbi:MAG: diaminopimelate epimerase [Gammaproteobacteria bacterium]